MKQSVLLIAPSFFDYQIDIINEIKSRKIAVDFIEDRPLKDPILRAFVNFFPRSLQFYIDEIYFKKILAFNAKSYTDIIVINGQTLSSSIILFLKKRHPKAKLKLYMWDSLKNRPIVSGNLKYFNQIFTFDSYDAQSFGLKFMPLFFNRILNYNNYKVIKKKYDISFVGTIHSNRYLFLEKLNQSIPKNLSRFFYFYLPARWVFYLYKVLGRINLTANISEFNFNVLPKKKLYKIILNSSTIIDIEHPSQTGLTIRTIEALGFGCKVITTNKNILSCDLYNSQNICLVNKDFPIVPESFFYDPFKPYSSKIINKYSLSCWVTKLLK
jgi:hypothetical protein